MSAIGDHIQAAIDAGKFESMADLARRLHVEKSTVTRWTSGTTAPSTKEAVALADLLDMKPAVLIAECDLEREKDPAAREVRELILRFLRKATSTAALMALLAVTLFVTSTEKALANQTRTTAQGDNLQIIASLKRRFAAWLKRLWPWADASRFGCAVA